MPGVIIVDGGVFSDAMPDRLRRLSPPGLDRPREERERIRKMYDARRPYAFTPHSRIDPATGSQRLKGPAMTGRLRCPNNPKSMRLPRSKPLAGCKPGTCACGSIVTLPFGDDAHLRQVDAYGTSTHAASYARRVGIESVNADARVHRGHIGRAFTRVHGLAKTGILLTFAFAGLNVRILHDWHDARGMDDPWAVALGEAEDTRPRQLLPRRRQRLTLRQRLTGNSDSPVTESDAETE